MYKVILFNHGETAANGRVLLDTSSGENPGLTQAVVETKLNEAGSFSYAIVPTHPLYEMTAPLKVYVVVEEDGTEIFYGRIISVQINPLTKIKAVTCEGALAFLLDCELPKDSDDRKSTAANYFTYCVNKYNEGIRNDPNRLLRVGTIDVDNASEQHTYKNGSYSQVQSVMKSQLLDVHDGFFRVRKDSGTGEHYIDWVKQVGQTNPQRIAITHNVISQNSTESGEDIFSLMRPLGKDDITISDSGGLLTVSQNMLDDYGAIIRSVNFDADSSSSLKTKALEYIEKIKNRLTITGDISFVDFHFLDGSSPKVHVGDVFTNIEGYDGVKLTAESVTRNLLDAGKDKLSIKNDKELMKSAAASGANSSRSTGTSSGGRASRNSAMMYKFYHETNTDASIQARNIALEADKKIELKAQEVVTYADQIDEQLSDAIGKVKIDTDTLTEEWSLYKGTEIYRNKEHIDQVCGLYKVVETKDPRTGEVTDRKLIVKEGTGLYQTRNGVELGVYDNGNLTGGIMARMINGQTETLINGDRVKINGNTTINDVITINENGQAVFGRTVAIGNADSGFTQINGPKVTANTLSVRENGSLDFTIGHGESAAPMSLTGSILSTMIQSFAINDNVLTLTRMNGTSETFSKATSLSGTWSGGSLPKELTVTASPQGNTYKVQFDGTYSATRTNLEVSLGGSISIETVMGAKMLSIPVNISRLTGTSSAPDIVYQTNISAAYNALLETRSVSANDTYTPGSNYIGIGSIRVNVPNKIAVNSEDGLVYIASTGSDSLAITAAEPVFTYNDSGHYYRATVYAYAGDTLMHTAISLGTSGTKAYTDGKTDGHGEMGVEVDSGNGLVKVAQSSTKSVAITATPPTFSYNESGHYYTATTTPTAGGVSMGPVVSLVNSGTRAYTDGKTDGHGEMGIEADAQNSLVKVVQGSTKSLPITIPNPTFTYDDDTHEYRVTMTAKAGNTTIVTATSTNTSGKKAYNDGWDGCVATKKWVADASKTLSYGEAVNVIARIDDKNGNPVNIGNATYVAPDYATPYNAGGSTAWVVSVGAVASPEQFTPGTYISPSYVKYGASSATVKDHTWYVPTAWLDSAGSTAPSGTTSQGELAYNTIYYVRYQTPTGWDGNKWASGFWKTKKDRWQDGYDQGKIDGAASVSYPYDAWLECSDKVKTYSGSSIYNYTFTCKGASSTLASIGDKFHMHWK